MKKYSTEEQQRRAKINKRKKMLRMPLTIVEKFYYRIKRFWENKIKYPIKWFFQRGIRGYDDRAHWNMNWWFLKIAPKIIREIKERTPGTPVDIEYDEWMNILEKMASYFENSLKEEDLSYEDYGEYEKYIEHLKKQKENLDAGLELFIRHFNDLWW